MRDVGVIERGQHFGLALEASHSFRTFSATSRLSLVSRKANDPLIFVALSLFLATVALAASYVAARRATKMDPIVVFEEHL